MLDEPFDLPIDEDRRDGWLHGRCGLFAAALHRLTGLPINAWIQHDEEIGATVLVHAFVTDGTAAFDAYGRRDPEGLLFEYEHWRPELATLTEAEVLALGETPETIEAWTAAAEADAALVAARLVPSPVPGA